MGYIWVLEDGLKLDMEARPETLLEELMILGTVLPIIPVMSVTGITWMFLMARLLSPADIRYNASLKGPRLPVISGWLDRLWLRMIATKPGEDLTSDRVQED